MMTKLAPYADVRRELLIGMVAAFFAEHYTISENEPAQVNAERLQAAEEDMKAWLEREDAALFVIEEDGREAGFLLLARHGGTVVWIENLYVKKELRRRGIATRAIALAEDYAAKVMKAPAVSMDVIPQNAAAMRLYHSLGYDTLQMVTMRKPLGGAKREGRTDLLGLSFRI
ncbi:MAG: GNAT family N-acetyltransferase [Clostridia bacterium]|nr:GNAT family N-acetyltransferase [Clostridia bacterium]